MPATMQSVTTRGFGNGTFTGSVNLIPTLGFGLGEAVVSQPTVIPGTWADATALTASWADNPVTGSWGD